MADSTKTTSTGAEDIPPVVTKADKVETPDVPAADPQLDAIAELRKLVAELQAQVDAQSKGAPAAGSFIVPDVGFDKDDANQPKVIMTYGSESLVVQTRNSGILEALGWTVSGKTE